MSDQDARRRALSTIRRYLRECARVRRRGGAGLIEFGKFLGARRMAFECGVLSEGDFASLAVRGHRLVWARIWRPRSSAPTAVHVVSLAVH